MAKKRRDSKSGAKPDARASAKPGKKPGKKLAMKADARRAVRAGAKPSSKPSSASESARIVDHPILGPLGVKKEITLHVDGRKITAYEGEMIATALVAAGYKAFRYTSKYNEPRGIFCAIGRCTDCVMEVNGRPNVRTCVTPVEEGMRVNTQEGLGEWRENGSGGKGVGR
jgi:hypothetical protein